MKSKKCQFQQRKSVNNTDNEAAQLLIILLNRQMKTIKNH